jgi:hypothetical protein
VGDRWIPALRERRLPKRAVELPGEALRGLPAEDWLYADAELRYDLELRLAEELDLRDGGAFLDYPEKPRMLGLDLLLLRRDGSVHRLTDDAHTGLIRLPQLADELYYTARTFRLFTVERRAVPAERLLSILALDAAELRARLESDAPLL